MVKFLLDFRGGRGLKINIICDTVNFTVQQLVLGAELDFGGIPLVFVTVAHWISPLFGEISGERFETLDQFFDLAHGSFLSLRLLNSCNQIITLLCRKRNRYRYKKRRRREQEKMEWIYDFCIDGLPRGATPHCTGI